MAPNTHQARQNGSKHPSGEARRRRRRQRRRAGGEGARGRARQAPRQPPSADLTRARPPLPPRHWSRCPPRPAPCSPPPPARARRQRRSPPPPASRRPAPARDDTPAEALQTNGSKALQKNGSKDKRLQRKNDDPRGRNSSKGGPPSWRASRAPGRVLRSPQAPGGTWQRVRRGTVGGRVWGRVGRGGGTSASSRRAFWFHSITSAVLFASTCAARPPHAPLPPPPCTKWTRRVPHPVLIGHAASLTPY